jgi:hypothetical protein
MINKSKAAKTILYTYKQLCIYKKALNSEVLGENYKRAKNLDVVVVRFGVIQYSIYECSPLQRNLQSS